MRHCNYNALSVNFFPVAATNQGSFGIGLAGAGTKASAVKTLDTSCYRGMG